MESIQRSTNTPFSNTTALLQSTDFDHIMQLLPEVSRELAEAILGFGKQYAWRCYEGTITTIPRWFSAEMQRNELACQQMAHRKFLSLVYTVVNFARNPTVCDFSMTDVEGFCYGQTVALSYLFLCTRQYPLAHQIFEIEKFGYYLGGGSDDAVSLLQIVYEKVVLAFDEQVKKYAEKVEEDAYLREKIVDAHRAIFPLQISLSKEDHHKLLSLDTVSKVQAFQTRLWDQIRHFSAFAHTSGQIGITSAFCPWEKTFTDSLTQIFHQVSLKNRCAVFLIFESIYRHQTLLIKLSPDVLYYFDSNYGLFKSLPSKEQLFLDIENTIQMYSLNCQHPIYFRTIMIE